MASKEPVRFRDPAFPLDEVKALVTAGRVGYLGLNVQADIFRLDLSRDDVLACLLSLQPREFDVSLQYEGQPTRHDVYVVRRYPCPLGATDLYIKFKVFGSVLQVSLCSFHEAEY